MSPPLDISTGQDLRPWSSLKAGERILGSEVGPNSEHGEKTAEIILNHTCIKISHPDRSLRFYREVLGFREVMIWNTGPQTVWFLGQPVPDTPMSDVFKTMQSRSGLIELLYLHGTEPSQPPLNSEASTALGYFHIGLCVPSVEAILAKAADYEADGVRIIKPLGPPMTMGVMGLPADTPAFHSSTDFIFSKVAFVSDPDGNWIELIPQEMHRAREVVAQ